MYCNERFNEFKITSVKVFDKEFGLDIRWDFYNLNHQYHFEASKSKKFKLMNLASKFTPKKMKYRLKFTIKNMIWKEIWKFKSFSNLNPNRRIEKTLFATARKSRSCSSARCRSTTWATCRTSKRLSTSRWRCWPY